MRDIAKREVYETVRVGLLKKGGRIMYTAIQSGEGKVGNLTTSGKPVPGNRLVAASVIRQLGLNFSHTCRAMDNS